MAANLIFMVPFQANLTWPMRLKLGQLLNLQIKRTDDWDDEVGFRLVGSKGAIRLYQLDTNVLESNAQSQYYELHGTTVDSDSQDLVASEFAACQDAVIKIGGRIDEIRVINPSEEDIGLQRKMGRLW